MALPLLLREHMQPALIRYAKAPRPRLLRYFLIGFGAALAGLYAGHAAVDALEDAVASRASYARATEGR